MALSITAPLQNGRNKWSNLKDEEADISLI